MATPAGHVTGGTVQLAVKCPHCAGAFHISFGLSPFGQAAVVDPGVQVTEQVERRERKARQRKQKGQKVAGAKSASGTDTETVVAVVASGIVDAPVASLSASLRTVDAVPSGVLSADVCAGLHVIDGGNLHHQSSDSSVGRGNITFDGKQRWWQRHVSNEACGHGEFMAECILLRQVRRPCSAADEGAGVDATHRGENDVSLVAVHAPDVNDVVQTTEVVETPVALNKAQWQLYGSFQGLFSGQLSFGWNTAA